MAFVKHKNQGFTITRVLGQKSKIWAAANFVFLRDVFRVKGLGTLAVLRYKEA